VPCSVLFITSNNISDNVTAICFDRISSAKRTLNLYHISSNHLWRVRSQVTIIVIRWNQSHFARERSVLVCGQWTVTRRTAFIVWKHKNASALCSNPSTDNARDISSDCLTSGGSNHSIRMTQLKSVLSLNESITFNYQVQLFKGRKNVSNEI